MQVWSQRGGAGLQGANRCSVFKHLSDDLSVYLHNTAPASRAPTHAFVRVGVCMREDARVNALFSIAGAHAHTHARTHTHTHTHTHTRTHTHREIPFGGLEVQDIKSKVLSGKRPAHNLVCRHDIAKLAAEVHARACARTHTHTHMYYVS